MTRRDGEKLSRLRLMREAERMRDRVDRETRPFQDIVARLTETSMRVSAERLEREILAELTSWGRVRLDRARPAPRRRVSAVVTDAFDRVPMVYRPLIEYARTLIEPRIGRLFPWPRFLCGVSPHFAGLHYYKPTDPEWPYTMAAHCVWSTHLDHRPRADRQTTIVIPMSPSAYRPYGRGLSVGVVVHEVAHAIHDHLGLAIDVPTTTPYSKTNDHETFAEALEILVCSDAGLTAYQHWTSQIDAPAFDPLREAVGWNPAVRSLAL